MPVIDVPDTPIISEYLSFPVQGMIDNREPTLLTPFQATRLLNCDLTIDGAFKPDNGLVARGAPSSDRAFGLAPYDAPGSSNPRVLVGKWGTSLYSYLDSTMAWTLRNTGYPLANTYYGFAVQGEYLYAYSTHNPTDASSETYAAVFRLHAANGWANTSFSDTSAYLRPRQIITFGSRLWGIRENRLAWGNVNNPNPPTFLDAAQRILWNDADRNVAIAPARDATPRLFIFRENSVWLLDIYWSGEGYGATSSNTLDFTQAKCRPLIDSVGLISTRAVAWSHPFGSSAGDYIWLARDGIHSMSRDLAGGQAGSGRPLSHRIQNLIDRINWARAETACAASWKGITYFAVPLDGAMDPNYIICYDQNRDAFYENDKAGVAFARASFSTKETRFYFQGVSSYSETFFPTGAVSSATIVYGPNVYQMDCGASDSLIGTRTGFAGQPYSFRIETRALTFDLDQRPGSGLQYEKRWLTTHLSFQAGATSATVALYYKTDHSTSWNLLKHIPVTSDYAGILKKSFDLTFIPCAYRIQFAIEDTTSYATWKLLEWFVEAVPLNAAFGR